MSIRQSVKNAFVGQPIAQPVWKTLKKLNIAKSTKRGFRGGWMRKKLHIKTHTTERAYKAPSIRHMSSSNLKKIAISSHEITADCSKLPKARLATWNADSIKRKTSSISDMIIEQKLDILAITESWLSGDERDDYPLADLKTTLPHFKIYHAPRVQQRGGGVCLLVHQGLEVKLNDTHNFRSFE